MELLGNLTMSDVVIPVNVTLLSGSATLLMTNCGKLVNVIVLSFLIIYTANYKYIVNLFFP